MEIYTLPKVTDEDYQREQHELPLRGKALRNPKTLIRIKAGEYFYSPDGKHVRRIFRNSTSVGYVYGDVWQSGLRFKSRIYGSNLREVTQKIDNLINSNQ